MPSEGLHTVDRGTTAEGRLSGRVAIVTGAAGGLGAAQAALFVAEGAHVVLTDLIDGEGNVLADELGARAEYVHHDVGDEAAWTELVQHVDSTYGRVDILVNNAGITRAGSLEEFQVDDFNATVRVNQLGVLLGMRAVIAPMRRAGGGSIINIASAASIRGLRNLIVYSGTKFAVRGMSRVAAAELAPDNIRVNAIHPGATDTPMHRKNPSELHTKLLERIPLKRFGEPGDIAEMALFLASDASSYVTGSDFLVDGGFLL